MINWSAFASSKFSCVWKGEKNNGRDKAKSTFRTRAEVSEREVEAPVRPSAPQLVYPVRTASAWLTALHGSLITSRCAVAKSAGQKKSPSLAAFSLLCSEANKKMTRGLKSKVSLSSRTFTTAAFTQKKPSRISLKSSTCLRLKPFRLNKNLLLGLCVSLGITKT